MSENKLILKSPEFFHLAKEKTKFERALNKSRVDEAKPGYVMDQWGSYVPETKVNKLLDVYKQLAEIDDVQEAQAIRYGWAGFLLTLNRFEEAKTRFEALAEDRPEKNAWDIFNLAIIAAKQGNFEEARRLAEILNAEPDKFIHITEERIQEEYDNYQKIAKV